MSCVTRTTTTVLGPTRAAAVRTSTVVQRGSTLTLAGGQVTTTQPDQTQTVVVTDPGTDQVAAQTVLVTLTECDQPPTQVPSTMTTTSMTFDLGLWSTPSTLLPPTTATPTPSSSILPAIPSTASTTSQAQTATPTNTNTNPNTNTRLQQTTTSSVDAALALVTSTTPTDAQTTPSTTATDPDTLLSQQTTSSSVGEGPAQTVQAIASTSYTEQQTTYTDAQGVKRTAVKPSSTWTGKVGETAGAAGESKGSQSPSDSTGKIVGIVMGLLVLLALVICGGIFVVHHINKRKRAQASFDRHLSRASHDFRFSPHTSLDEKAVAVGEGGEDSLSLPYANAQHQRTTSNSSSILSFAARPTDNAEQPPQTVAGIGTGMVHFHTAPYHPSSPTASPEALVQPLQPQPQPQPQPQSVTEPQALLSYDKAPNLSIARPFSPPPPVNSFAQDTLHENRGSMILPPIPSGPPQQETKQNYSQSVLDQVNALNFRTPSKISASAAQMWQPMAPDNVGFMHHKNQSVQSVNTVGTTQNEIGLARILGITNPDSASFRSSGYNTPTKQ